MRPSGALLPDERRRLIAERLLKQGSVSVSALEAEFQISSMTARRDLDDRECMIDERLRDRASTARPGTTRRRAKLDVARGPRRPGKAATDAQRAQRD